MSDKANDPVQVWHTMLAEMEKGFNAMATQVMGTEQFSRVTHQLTGASVGAQKTIGDLMERYLVSMNLPSRAQMVDMGERLNAIEGQLNEIKALLNRVHGDAARDSGLSAPKPPRTKQPPAATGGGGTP
ncbi:hypothetical protein [Bradyrhizobium sp. G127]|jgi:SMC interacting uncharacterized protein involved in chromosome segregation|uniref:hypothetical protein n=1 Tax=Bradyrhizobium sp. G127 TaxID=2904800 RepID=UPI001F175401|nr:hypothetical protein [Bradyrhizobium sp. G127]MCF2522888.1 hypothetical protein [Bradyrhizobium sp. G127]